MFGRQRQGGGGAGRGGAAALLCSACVGAGPLTGWQQPTTINARSPARVGIRRGQRRQVGPLMRRLAGAAATLCLAHVWAGPLTCWLALRARWRWRRQGGAAARDRAADVLAHGGSCVALLSSRLGRDSHVSARAARLPAGGGSGAGSGC